MSTSVRINIGQYDEMIEQGQFVPREDHHVELLEGEIVAMSPIYPPHSEAVERLTEWSYEARLAGQIKVRVQDPIDIPELDSVPEPDLFWVRHKSYRRRRPRASDVLLLVEVADSSLATDRGRKARIYARAGIADYWIVNIPDRCVEVRRDPDGSSYRSVATYGPGQSIALLAFPTIALPVTTIFPADDDEVDAE